MTLDQSYCVGTRCELKKSCRLYLPATVDVVIYRIAPAFDGVECPNYEESEDPYCDAIDRGLCPKCAQVLRSESGCYTCHGCGWSACQ